MYLALYLDPPDGFERAIQDGEQFLKSSTPTDGSLWMNLACAYGQKYAYYKNLQKPDVLDAAKRRARECIEEALKVEPSSIDRFNELYHGTGPDPQDDDLKVFEKEKVFDDLLRKS